LQLASHVLQLVFLTPGGFRFPFCHFATREAQAPELFAIFWQAVYWLQERNFIVNNNANT
jgi:hypothetical protein